jgi:hypothetical protein
MISNTKIAVRFREIPTAVAEPIYVACSLAVAVRVIVAFEAFAFPSRKPVIRTRFTPRSSLVASLTGTDTMFGGKGFLKSHRSSDRSNVWADSAGDVAYIERADTNYSRNVLDTHGKRATVLLRGKSKCNRHIRGQHRGMKVGV